MDLKCDNLSVNEFPSIISKGGDDFPVPEIGSSVVISESQSDVACDSPSKIWTGKRALCSFSSNNNVDADEYPFHAVTYGEPGELHGLPYNDHNYAKLSEDDSSNDNQLVLLAKVALSGKESDDHKEQRSDNSVKLPGVTTSSEVVTSSGFRGPSVPHVTIIKAPVLSQNYHSTSTLQPTLGSSTCKVATSNGRTVLLTPSRGNLGASVQIHRVSSVSQPSVVLRTGDSQIINGNSNSGNTSIRCICGIDRDDGYLIQCSSCKVFQHAECMAPSSGNILPKPYLCELCQPRPLMVGDAIGLQRRKTAIANAPTTLGAKTIRLTGSTTAFRLPRSNVPTATQVHGSAMAPNRIYLAGNPNVQQSNVSSLSVRPIQVRLGGVVGSSGTGTTLYQVNSAAFNHFSPRFINLDANASRQQPQPSHVTNAGTQRSSKRKQDLFTLAGESPSTLDNMTHNYSFEETTTLNGQRPSVSNGNDRGSARSCTEGNDLPGPMFYRTGSHSVTMGVVENTKSQPGNTFGDISGEIGAITTVSSGVPEPASSDVVIWSESYEKAAETRLSDALKHRIRNIFLTPSERELKTLKMADSVVLSRGLQRCRVATLEFGRKGLVATEPILPNQPIIEYKGHAMLMDEYSQQCDYKRKYNPFVLFYKQLDKALICLDASNYGNEARFIRRSCVPNCEVRLTFPPTDSFSSVVNPQCIQFVVTSAVNRMIPAGTELTVGFDFDYTACHYPVRCACGRGASACVVADWFKRHQLSLHLNRHNDHDDKEGPWRNEDDYEFGDNGGSDSAEDEYRYDQSRSRIPLDFEDNASRSRLPHKRLLTSKRVSPAFSRVPYPSAKHMVQEQHRRQKNGLLIDSFPSGGSKRGGARGVRGSRGGGRGRGGVLVRQTSKVGRPRGRPPNSSLKRGLPANSPPPSLPTPPSRGYSDIDPDDDNERSKVEEIEKRVRTADPELNRPVSPTSSSPRTDVTEPGATSASWLYSDRSPIADPPRGRRYSDVASKVSRRREHKRIIRQRQSSSKPHSPRKKRLKSSIKGSLSGNLASPVFLPDDSVLGDERQVVGGSNSPTQNALPKVKRVRKMSARMPPNGTSSAKRMRRQSDIETYEKGTAGDQNTEQTGPSRSNDSREDKWLAEVMRRIERMERKHKKTSADKKLKREKSGDDEQNQNSSEQMPPSRSLSPVDGQQKRDEFVKVDKKEDDAVVEKTVNKHPDQEETKEAITLELPKKQHRKSTSWAVNESHSSSTAHLSREDRWMQWQIQRIAAMESSDTPNGGKVDFDQQNSIVNSSTSKQRRRSGSGAKSVTRNLSPQKARGEEECSLIVYKRREQDPMAKFSRTRTGHQQNQQLQNFHSKSSYNLVDNFADEDLPAGGELLEDHTNTEANGDLGYTDAAFCNATQSTNPSPPKPSKKRWLSQALMEEDQQHHGPAPSRTTPSPETSLTPPDSVGNSLSQRVLNPKKRIISQIKEAMAQLRQSPSPSESRVVDALKNPDCTSGPSSKLPPKKRQSEEEIVVLEFSNDSVVEEASKPEPPPKPKPEKVRMSLSEYRRRRGLSITAVAVTNASESTDKDNGKTPAQVDKAPLAATPASAPPQVGTPPLVDVKKFDSCALPPALPLESLSGPRTPSEPSSDDEEHIRKGNGVSPKQLLGRPTDSFCNSFSQGSGEAAGSALLPQPPPIVGALSHRLPPPETCDRHLSGHAQRRASPPPPPPNLNVTSSDPSSLVVSLPPLSLENNVLKRDREILQWQVQRNSGGSNGQHHRSFSSSSATSHHRSGGSHQHHRRYYHSDHAHSSPSPGVDFSRSHTDTSLSLPINPPPPPHSSHHRHHLPMVPSSNSPALAFTNHDAMEGMQESLRRNQEHLRSKIRDLQKAAAGGSG